MLKYGFVLFLLTMMCSVSAQSQQQVYGTVRDTSGVSLVGVSVSLKEKGSTGTTTDLNGKYIRVVPIGAVLLFNMMGYEGREVSVEKGGEVNVVLEQSSQGIDDVVVVAFGRQRKQDLIGAVTTVNPS